MHTRFVVSWGSVACVQWVSHTKINIDVARGEILCDCANHARRHQWSRIRVGAERTNQIFVCPEARGEIKKRKFECIVTISRRKKKSQRAAADLQFRFRFALRFVSSNMSTTHSKHWNKIKCVPTDVFCCDCRRGHAFLFSGEAATEITF